MTEKRLLTGDDDASSSRRARRDAVVTSLAMGVTFLGLTKTNLFDPLFEAMGFAGLSLLEPHLVLNGLLLISSVLALWLLRVRYWQAVWPLGATAWVATALALRAILPVGWPLVVPAQALFGGLAGGCVPLILSLLRSSAVQRASNSSVPTTGDIERHRIPTR